MKCAEVVDKLYLASGNAGDLGNHRKIPYFTQEETRHREGNSPKVSNWQNGTQNTLDSQDSVSHVHLRTLCWDIQRRGVTFAGTLLTWEEVFPTDFFYS